MVLRPLRVPSRGCDLWFLLGGTILILAAIFGWHAEANARWIVVAMTGSCALGIIAYALYGVNRYVEFGDEIVVHYFFRNRTIPWSEVTFVNFGRVKMYSHVAYVFVIPTENHTCTLRLKNGKALTFNIGPSQIRGIAEVVEQRATLDVLREQKRREAESTSHQRADRWFSIVGGVGILLGGIWCAAWMGARIVDGPASVDWPSATGSVTISQLASVSSVESGREEVSYYYPVIEYTYCIDRKTYSGNRIQLSLDDQKSTDPGYMQAFLNNFKPSQTIQVRYKPTNPSVSVLIPGIPPGDVERCYAVLGVGVILAIAGLLLAISNVIPMLRKTSNNQE